ncbi:MAG: PqqD family protein [Bryobacteraceae bacterium]
MCFSLNPLGARIWNAVKNGDSREDIIRMLCEEFRGCRSCAGRKGYRRVLVRTCGEAGSAGQPIGEIMSQTLKSLPNWLVRLALDVHDNPDLVDPSRWVKVADSEPTRRGRSFVGRTSQCETIKRPGPKLLFGRAGAAR